MKTFTFGDRVTVCLGNGMSKDGIYAGPWCQGEVVGHEVMIERNDWDGFKIRSFLDNEIRLTSPAHHNFLATGDAVQYRRSGHDSWSYARVDEITPYRYILKDGVQVTMCPPDMFPENLRIMEGYHDPDEGEKAEILRYFGYPWTSYWLGWKEALKAKFSEMGKVVWRGQAYPDRKLPPPLQAPAPASEGVGSGKPPEDPKLFTGNCPPGTKDDNGKESFRYIPFKALREVNKVLAYGAKRYAPNNWKTLDDAKMRYWDAAMRHLTEWKEEGHLDTGPKGSGLRHLAHAATSCLFALWFEITEEEKTAKEK